MTPNDKVMQLATEAANLAGDVWLENATPQYQVETSTMLDLCGNAHVKFIDKRSAWFKSFKKEGFTGYSGVVQIHHKHKGRQEHGLALACAEAAKKVLDANGVFETCIWDYID